MQEQLLQEENNIKEYLNSVAFETLLKERKKAQVKPAKKERPPKQKQQKAEKRDKNTPMEISAKRRPQQIVVFEKKKSAVDPRYVSYTGKLNATLADKAYAFIPQLQQRDKQQLEKSLKKKMTPEEREILLRRYNQVTDNIRKSQKNILEREVERENKQKVNEDLQKGHKTFYKTKKIIKEETQKRQMDSATDGQTRRLFKEKDQRIESRLQFRGRQYARNSKN